MVSNKRSIQIYSDKVLNLFTEKGLPFVEIRALGAAIPTAIRIAQFCVDHLNRTTDFFVTCEIETGTQTRMLARGAAKNSTIQGDGFGQLPLPGVPEIVQRVTIYLRKEIKKEV
jgi:hypothetical protein